MFTRRVISFFIFMVFSYLTVNAQSFESKAPQALVIDADTGTVLFSKDADKRIPPASLAKLMTMEVVFNRLKSGNLSLEDKFFVSENAWKKGGRIPAVRLCLRN